MTDAAADRGWHLFSAGLRRGYCLHTSANTLRSLVEGGGVEQREKRKRKKVTSNRGALMDGPVGLAQSSHE